MSDRSGEPTTVGGRIRLARTRRALTLEQVAEKAGISKSFLWEVEQGSDISGERLLRVANVLGASLDYLLRGAPATENYEPPTVEIPSELSSFAQQEGLSFRLTMALMEIDRSVKTHRRDERIVRDQEYWRRLYESVKPFLEDKP